MDDPRTRHSKTLSGASGLVALIAFITCNGLSLIVAVFSFFGVIVAVGPHVQAAAITAFVLLSLGFVGELRLLLVYEQLKEAALTC